MDRMDRRVRDINLKRGTLTRKDIEKHIKNLDDDSAWAEEIVVYEEETAAEESAPEDASEATPEATTDSWDDEDSENT